MTWGSSVQLSWEQADRSSAWTTSPPPHPHPPGPCPRHMLFTFLLCWGKPSDNGSKCFIFSVCFFQLSADRVLWVAHELMGLWKPFLWLCRSRQSFGGKDVQLSENTRLIRHRWDINSHVQSILHPKALATPCRLKVCGVYNWKWINEVFLSLSSHSCIYAGTNSLLLGASSFTVNKSKHVLRRNLILLSQMMHDTCLSV